MGSPDICRQDPGSAAEAELELPRPAFLLKAGFRAEQDPEGCRGLSSALPLPVRLGRRTRRPATIFFMGKSHPRSVVTGTAKARALSRSAREMTARAVGGESSNDRQPRRGASGGRRRPSPRLPIPFLPLLVVLRRAGGTSSGAGARAALTARARAGQDGWDHCDGEPARSQVSLSVSSRSVRGDVRRQTVPRDHGPDTLPYGCGRPGDHGGHRVAERRIPAWWC